MKSIAIVPSRSWRNRIALTLGAFALAPAMASLPAAARAEVRQQIPVEGEWRSVLFEAEGEASPKAADQPFHLSDFDDRGWSSVLVPHNWQGYSYARQVVKGSRHGTAWYRKKLVIRRPRPDERILLMFEGVGTYATIWLNGQRVGRHAGGLTSFTVDATAAVRDGENLLAVRADNPAGIRDLPWAPGDDYPANGFAEGSQPFGIFRPVHVIRASSVRVRPFGLFAWGDTSTISKEAAALTVRTELRNDSARTRSIELINELVDAEGKVVSRVASRKRLAPGQTVTHDQLLPSVANPKLWSPGTPYLYSLRARLSESGRILDEYRTPYGIRTLEISTDAEGRRRLLVNGEQAFIHGTAEYEHLLGNSHAFTPEQIRARLEQVKAAGFNAFRDAHYPHNLRYQEQIARDGLLWWPQFSAHIWFDNPEFRANFKALLADWVRERRNNPAHFMWGLQNESVLPADFAKEAVQLIRELDPTASSQRLVVTVNGGVGSDWNVPQNWSGTYGGDPDKYAEELRKQGLVGEYGAWRSLGRHEEAPTEGNYTESYMAWLLEKKARLALSTKGDTIGDFQWLLATHENPGRPMRRDGTQIWDGIRPLEHTGPANNKGLMTLWGEPVDAYYMYRAKHVPASESPVVYIVSHSWPDRWAGPGLKSGIIVYSNCEAVELYNDVGGKLSLGRKARPVDGSPFRFDNVPVRYNVLSARCIVNGVVQARDVMTFNNLPPAPDFGELVKDRSPLTRAAAGRRYLYRVNAGGPDLVDGEGNLWLGDRHLTDGSSWGWRSWADQYPDLDPQLGSRRKTYDPIEGASEQSLLQDYRFGREQLSYSFDVPAGEYEIEFYFVEPWYGRTGIEATGWRLFDVAVNGTTLLKDVDIFREAGFNRALKKVVRARSVDGKLVISFPRVAAGQAVLSALAISAEGGASGQSAAERDGSDLVGAFPAHAGATIRTYLDNGDQAFGAEAAYWTRLPYELLDSDWVRPERRSQSDTVRFRTREQVDIYLALPQGTALPRGWNDAKLTASLSSVGGNGTDLSEVHFAVRRFAKGAEVALPLGGGPALIRRALTSPYAPGIFTFSRQVGLHEAENAQMQNVKVATAIKGYGGQGYVVSGAGKASLQWSVSTGVASRYAFTIRYAAIESDHRIGRLVLRDASGIVTAEMPVQFTGEQGAGWAEVVAVTPTLINAGDYSASLEWEGPLAVDSLTLK